MDAYELTTERLYRACEPVELAINTTADLPDVDEAPGQTRALEALRFGVGMPHESYNLFVMGSTGLGKHTTVLGVLEAQVAGRPPPPDWCYVNNFRAPHKPKALSVPAGTGVQLQRDMQTLVRDLLLTLPAAFESDEYQLRVTEINEEFKARQEKAFEMLVDEARKTDIVVVRTPVGYTVGPMKNGEVMEVQEFEKLPDEEKHRLEQNSAVVRQNLTQFMQNIATWHREHEHRIEQLNSEVARSKVGRLFAEAEQRYGALPEVLAFLQEVQTDLVGSVDDIRKLAANNKNPPDAGHRLTPFNRWYVNLVVDNSASPKAPVVYEDHPTYQNLVGRIEHLAQFGTLLTDFTMIKAGALHRANGGYLILDARKVLSQPFAWDTLKRVLRAREIRIQSLEQMLSVASTISIEPEPIPLDVKVVLTGERLHYYLLNELDPEFGLLFKIASDFSEDMPRTPESTLLYARTIATVQRREKLRAADRGAVARLIEQASRAAADSEKLSLHMGELVDLMREADRWASQSGDDVIGARHVDRALEARLRWSGQARERMREAILRNMRLIETSGSRVAEVNALAVVMLGKYVFGHPSRITATARLGEGEVVDIEREVELGGAVHSKGVLILSSFIAQRFAPNNPLSLSASLVFEQTYGSVEGDSASVAELCALLSALSDLPLRQDVAVTGSVNQHGAVQAVGGVNEKIEGFFDICNARGLSGSQGVIIPESNVRNLMLRAEVLEAARNGRFHVYAVSHVDQAMEVLTGQTAGAPADDGLFPEDSINGRVQRRLVELSVLRQEFARPPADGAEREPGS
jgi:lon-related putative ATP-dependent protease